MVGKMNRDFMLKTVYRTDYEQLNDKSVFFLFEYLKITFWTSF